MTMTTELVELADRLEQCVSDWSYDMKDAAFAQLNQFPDELRALASRAGGSDDSKWRDLLLAIVTERPKRSRNHHGDAPGHSHDIAGIWDSDNGALAGKACAWCKAWREAELYLAAKAGPHVPEPVADPEPLRYVVLKAPGSRFAYVQDTQELRTVRRYDILKGQGDANGWSRANRDAEILNRKAAAPEPVAVGSNNLSNDEEEAP